MNLVQQREYISLLLGDVFVFAVSLYFTLAIRYLAWPSSDLWWVHAIPFSILYASWIAVFFIAGLYGKHTRLFRRQLPTLIFTSQIINMAIAAIFFFFIPIFGIAPKTNLLLYLVVSSPLIFMWRVLLYPRLRLSRTLRGVLMASGPDAKALAEEIARDPRYSFTFTHVIDTEIAPPHEVIQRAIRVAEDDEATFIVIDYADPKISAALPIMYDAAFHKQQFALIDIVDLYQEVFDRVPLSLTRYAWVLEQASASPTYDTLKRSIDILGAFFLGTLTLIFYPFAYIAIRMEDRGDIFITQERVGKFERPVKVYKFRSMTGNDSGNYGASGKTSLSVTKVGKWLRILRIDELPQLWSVLRGDLSLVGPRPELPSLAKQYSARIPYYNARYLVSPGLTGWAQIHHDAHPHHGTDIQETKEKLSYDLYYLCHRSLWLDVFILFQTIRIVLSAKGS